jgi:hypothetical protein
MPSVACVTGASPRYDDCLVPRSETHDGWPSMSNALNAGGWRVLPLACVEHGEYLRAVRPSHLPHPLAHNPRAAITAETLMAAVCHGTNWDRLRKEFMRNFVAHPLRIERLATLTRDQFGAEFGNGFSPREDYARMSRRYELFVDTASALAVGDIDLDRMLRPLVRLGGDYGLLEHLRATPSFAEDARGKKLRILVQQLLRFNLINASDPDSLPPAIEYHLLRVYLRTGRVVPTTPSARRSVTVSEVRRLDSINALRRAVEEAMHITASTAGITLLELNDAEWQIGRSLCLREEPRCGGPELQEKPLDPGLISAGGGCLFAPVCAVANGTAPSAWREPQLAEKHRSIY